jgi:hypothetical protein
MGRRQDPGAQAAFGREHLHLSAQALALTQGGSRGVQHLGEVAPDLALDPDRHDDPGEVDALHPLAMPSSASSIGTPRRASTSARSSSGPIGAAASAVATASMAWGSE